MLEEVRNEKVKEGNIQKNKQDGCRKDHKVIFQDRVWSLARMVQFSYRDMLRLRKHLSMLR